VTVIRFTPKNAQKGNAPAKHVLVSQCCWDANFADRYCDRL